jgi:abortive infection Abi-like protein
MAAETTSFVMHGARTAIASGLIHIEEQVKGIELAVADNPGLAFDLAKTVIESACRTILTERSIGFDPDDDLPKLFKTVTMNLPFLPASASGSREVRDSLDRTLGGLRAAVQGVCELRNACGFASHGSDSPRPAMETIQAILAAETADAIVGFLYRVHRQDHISRTTRRLAYADNAEFNEYVDGMHDPVRVFNEEFPPSRVLFELAPEPYRLYLAEFSLDTESGSEDLEQTAVPEAANDAQVVPLATGEIAAAASAVDVERPRADEVADD